MKKRYLALLLALSLIMVMFAGCGSSDDDESSEEVESEVAESTETEDEDTEEDEAEDTSEADEEAEAESDSASMYPVSDETIYLTGVAPQEPDLASYQSDFSDLYAQVTASEKTNVEIEWEYSSYDTYSDTLAIIISSGSYEDFDLLLTPDNYYSIDYLIDEEICIDISEYRDYAPDFFEVYDSDELFAGEITSDSGRIVSMWGRYTLANTIIGIRADWLEALELDVPTTYDELTETLRAFQVEYDTVDTICLMQSGYMANGSGILTGGYGVQSPDSSTDLPWQVTEDGEVVMSYTLEGYEKYFTLINSWYEEGIISDNFLSWTNPGNFDDPILNNEAGVVATRAANFSASYQSGAADESFELRPIADVTETEGQTITTGGGRGILASGGMAVTTSCEYPEEAIMYLNWYFTDEGHMAANFGEPDVMYTIDGDEITYTDFVMNNPDGFSYKVVLGLYTTYMGVGYDIDERQVTSAFTLRYETDMYTTWASNRTEDSVCYGTMTSEESDSYNEILADIVTYCNEKTLSYITGAESLDTYDEFIENLYDMGLQDLIDIKQAAYDRYIAR